MKLKPAISLEKNIPKHSTIKAIISKSFQKSSNSNIFLSKFICSSAIYLYLPTPNFCT